MPGAALAAKPQTKVEPAQTSGNTKVGTLKAKVPGVGHIGLRYEPTEHHKIGYSKGRSAPARPPRSAAAASSAAPDVEREDVASGGSEEASGEPQEQSLYAYGKADDGTVRFRVWSIPVLLNELPPRVVEFAAEYSRPERGMLFTASTVVKGKPGDFTVSPSNGLPSEAAVSPPAPFIGSAEFKLLSPAGRATCALRSRPSAPSN